MVVLHLHKQRLPTLNGTPYPTLGLMRSNSANQRYSYQQKRTSMNLIKKGQTFKEMLILSIRITKLQQKQRLQGLNSVSLGPSYS